MLLMAKQRKTTERKTLQRRGKPLNVWVPLELRDALDASAARNRRPLTTETVIALENYLTAQGLWPPRAAEENG
jgi:hypothetical protein